MLKLEKPVLLLLGGWLVLLALGVYVTFIQQPKELEHLQKAEEVARLKSTELVSLESNETSLSHMTEETLRKWRARYKIIPDELSSAEIVGYFNELTRSGYKNFDITYSGQHKTATYSYHSYTVTGRAYFTSLYDFVWRLENSPHLYRIESLDLDHIDLVSKDKQTQNERLDVMVSFTMRVNAIFNSLPGASATEAAGAESVEELQMPALIASDLPVVPSHLLPDRKPDVNPFYPVILKQLPPNTYGLLDVEASELVSVAGNAAVFRDDTGYRTVAVGDEIYLGTITEIDPVDGRVVARLNKGGIIDEVERRIDEREGFRRAQGSHQLLPAS